MHAMHLTINLHHQLAYDTRLQIVMQMVAYLLGHHSYHAGIQCIVRLTGTVMEMRTNIEGR